MRPNSILHRVALLVMGWLWLAASVVATERVTVFAASSLTNVLTEIGQRYRQAHNVDVRFSFAGSSGLARQIAYGAPADIYLSANRKWMDYLVDQRAVNADSLKPLLTNALVLIAHQSSSLKVPTLGPGWDIRPALAEGRLALADDHVPAGQYARQALRSLDLWQQVQSRLAGSGSVRGTLALVERGEAPLGVVYRTDAQVASKVRVVATLPSDSHHPIHYPMALVGAEPTPAAVAFYHYLAGAEAGAVFERHGFGLSRADAVKAAP